MPHNDQDTTQKVPWYFYIPVYIAPILLFLPALIPGKALFWGITSLQFIPWHWEALRSLQGGELPLWNIWNGLGAPLAANYQSALFYPPTWITLIAGSVGGLEMMAWSHGVLVVLHLIWAGVGMTYLMKKLGVSPIPQIICGLSYSLSGYFIGRGSFLTIIQAAAWIPWIILAASHVVSPIKDTVSERSTPKAILFLSLAYAGQWLSGHAQLSWYTLLFSLVWLTCGAFVNGGWKRLLKVITLVGMSGLLAFMVSAIQLIPTLEYLFQSQRSGSIDYQTALSYSYWPWRLLSLIFPNIFGNPGMGDFWGYANYWEDAAYFGLLPIFFCFYFLLTWTKRKKQENNKNKQPLFLLILITICVVFIFALGWNTPVYPWLFKNVPTFGAFNGPTRWMIILIFCMIITAGWGLEEWIKHPIVKRNQIYMLIVGVLAMLLAGFASIITMPEVKGSFKTSLISGGCLMAGYLVLSLIKPAIDRDKKIIFWRFAFVIWLMVDLFWAGWQLNPAVDVKLYASVPNDSQERFYFSQNSEKDLRFKRFFKFEDIREMDDWKNLIASYLPNSNILSSVKMVNNFDPMLPDRYLVFINEVENAKPEIRNRLLALANTGQIANVGIEPPYTISWETNKTYPEYWLSGCAQKVKNEREALGYLSKGAETDTLNAIVIIENGETSQPDCEKMEPGSKNILQSSHRLLNHEITVNGSDKERYLFIADAWYPGWKATVDGKDTIIYHADYVFMAVKVPAGATRIRLDYRPLSFIIGSVLTLAGTIFCVILGLWHKKTSGGSF